MCTAPAPWLAKASGWLVWPGADTSYPDSALCCVCSVCVLVATGLCASVVCAGVGLGDGLSVSLGVGLGVGLGA
jgi:hypothetical protein